MSALGITSLAAADLSGCASIPARSLPKLDYSGAMLITNASIVDVMTGRAIPGSSFIIDRGKISSLGPAAARSELSGFSAVIDLGGKYVIPGLIDAHCHTTLPGAGQFDFWGVSTTLYQLKRNHVQQIENGITNIKGGHPDIDPSDVSIFAKPTMLLTGKSSVWFSSVRELKDSLKESLENGASFIKLTMDNLSLMCGKGVIPVYSGEHLKIIFDFAEQHNLPVAGHIHRKFGFDRGLEYGINSMEHTIGDARISDEEIKLMAEKNIAIVPTMTVGQVFASEEAYDEVPREFRNDYIDNEVRIRREYLISNLDRFIEKDIHRANMEALAWYKKLGCEKCYDRGIMLTRPELYYGILKYGPDNVRRMKEAGVLIGCGTDAGVPFCYHGTLVREMEALTRLGFSNGEALKSATVNNARILGMGDTIGRIKENFSADMVVLDGNPLQDIGACRNPLMVVKNGRLAFINRERFSPSGKTLSLV
ncbi:MAG: hypothetical protein CVV44_17070 [Spirochaetae bacterium HGW-Spirochaetae-1]|nr:MAG: hypothetical protein CVV44_17070 [Spirochaetae bacterium HGW-Spirochaetae-1]